MGVNVPSGTFFFVSQNLSKIFIDILSIDVTLHDEVTKEIKEKNMHKHILNNIWQKHSCYL